MLNDIRKRFFNSQPSSDPVMQVMDRLPEEIVENYLKKTQLKHAAVLIGLVDDPKNGLSLLLTRRTTNLKHHAGEISLPGGSFDEDQDTDIQSTALREAKEEIGLSSEQTEILGFLEPQISLGTGFIVTPIIAHLESSFVPQIDTNEVEELFSVPLSFFTNNNNLNHEHRIFDQIKWSVYSYHYEDYLIWGLTAQIIRKFCHKIIQ
ncbi:MAG TPA: CoA pyrophosphatase [Gammaproteobacteria bacterium]|nr:CoA pyrophosphatase [Gammaproteobacteria bacterium]